MKEQDVRISAVENSRQPSGTVRGNPIFVREFRGLMRQRRAHYAVTLYLILLAVVAFLLYIAIMSANAASPDPDIRRTLGKIIFLAIISTQLITVILVVPLFSADAIASERENKTFDLLQITPLSASSIIIGKLFASIMFAMLLLLSSLPLQSSAYLLGGVTLAEFLVSAVLLLTTTIFLCSLSVWASARSKQSSSAIGLSNVIASAILLVLPAMLYVMMKIAPVPNDQGVLAAIQTLSKSFDPFFQTVFFFVVWFLVASNPVTTAIASYILFQSEGVQILYDLTAFQIPLLAPWIAFVVLYLIASWILYRTSVRQIAKKDRL